MQRTSASNRGTHEWATASDDTGAFVFRDLPNGDYTLCADAYAGGWLNPCVWGRRPLSARLSQNQRSMRVDIRLKRGAIVRIRLDDPAKLLAQHQGKTAGAEVLMGVSGDNFMFFPASITAQDEAGRTYGLLVPFAQPVKLAITSSFFQLADSAGIALPRSATTAIPVNVPAGAKPGTIVLRVVSGGQ